MAGNHGQTPAEARRGATGDPAPAMLNQARAHHRAGRLAEARALYQELLVAQPGNAGALYSLAVLAQQAGRLDLTIRHLKQAVFHRPDFLDAHIYLGNTHLATRQPLKAVPYYQRAVEIDPEHAGAHLNLASLFQQAGRFEQAVAHFEQALALEPELAEAHSSLGLRPQVQERVEAAPRAKIVHCTPKA
jgi:tetratricopeptide (TPR) repeat protein